MTRIGVTPSGVDLTAQNLLARAVAQVNRSSLQLSTLKRINRGSDDPAGLIALEQLRSELVSLERASSNAGRASSIVRVADTGLSQISGLLNTVRDNVLAAAGGGLSDAELAANQIEIDAALEAVNRISGQTSLGGRNLLDGSAGLQVSGVDNSQVADIQVFARGGGASTDLDIEVTQAATSAALTTTVTGGALSEDVTIEVLGEQGTTVLEFSAGATAQQIAAAVSSTSGTTGVTATFDGADVTFNSTGVGSDATVNVLVVSGTLDVGAGQAAGGDVVVEVNGQQITGNGDTVEIRTDALQADITFAAGFTGTVDPITVSGDALTFLFSPRPSDVSTLSLPSVSTSALGGAAGRLSDLAAGGSASLASGNFARAIDTLDSSRDQVLSTRARAGAFEKYTIDSSREFLDDAIVQTASAVSLIGDVDVALASANLVRGQILTASSIGTLRAVNGRRGVLLDLISDAI